MIAQENAELEQRRVSAADLRQTYQLAFLVVDDDFVRRKRAVTRRQQKARDRIVAVSQLGDVRAGFEDVDAPCVGHAGCSERAREALT
ncbi:MAG: hypothetical protein E6I75_20695 [Chloroflexi bacterium]|nr:MAG: hypothetical protein E6I75_20695 [Chloroflexota bacterium]